MSAFDAGTIYSEVRIAIDKLDGDIKAMQTKFDQIGKSGQEMGKSAGQGTDAIKDGLINMAKQLAATYLSFEAFKKIAQEVINVLKESFSIYVDAAKNHAVFDATLRAAGMTSQFTASALEKLNQQIEKNTIFSDEDARSAETLLMSIGGLDKNGVEKILPHIADLATLLGSDMRSAAQMVAQSMGDGRNMLAKYGIEVNKTATQSEKLTQITEQLNAKFGGLAEKVANNAGIMDKLNNATVDLKEEIGRSLIESLKGPIQWFTNLITKQQEALKADNDYKDAIKKNAAERTQADLIAITAKNILLAQQKADTLYAQAKLADTEAEGDAYVKLAEAEQIHVRELQKMLDSQKLQQANMEKATEEANKNTGANEDNIKSVDEKAKAEEAYGEALTKTATLLSLGVITAEDANSQNINAVNTLIDAYVGLGIRGGKEIDDLIDKLLELKKTTGDIGKDVSKPMIELATATGEAGAAVYMLNSALQQTGDNVKGLSDEMKKNLRDAIIGDIQDIISALDDLFQSLNDQYQEYLDEKLQSTLDELDAEMEAELEAAGLAEDTEMERLQKELADAKAKGDEETAARLQDEIDRLTIKQKYDALKLAAEKQAEKDKAQAEYDAAMVSWGLSLAKATTDAAAGIVAIWAQWAANPAIALTLSLIEGLATGISIAAIVAQEPKPPSFITGGIVLPSGDPGGTLVKTAEGGTGEMLFNSGPEGDAFVDLFAARVAAIVVSSLASGGSGEFTLQVDGTTLGKVITDLSKNKQALTYKGAIVE